MKLIQLACHNKKLPNNSMQFLLMSFFIYIAQAAPHPMTSTSMWTDPNKFLFYSNLPYRLSLPENSGLGINGEFTFHNQTASLLVKIIELPTNQSLESFSKKWIKDYSSLGFSILGSQSFAQDGMSGLVVDIFHRDHKKQLRQVLLKGNHQIAILTCQDDEKQFKDTLKICNQITKSFEWNFK